MKCYCTSRAETFVVAATDSIFDAERISHGQSIASPFCSTLFQWKLENRVSSLSFPAKTSVVVVVLFGLNSP